MTRVLVVADTSWVRNEVHAALTEPDTSIVDLGDPARAASVVMEDGIDVVIVDMQVGSMGAMAVTRAVREQLLLNDREPVPVVMLLDRAADGFLAKRAGAAAWVAKPFTSQDLLAAFSQAMEREMPKLMAMAEEISADAPGLPKAPSDPTADPA